MRITKSWADLAGESLCNQLDQLETGDITRASSSKDGQKFTNQQKTAATNCGIISE